MRSHPDLPPPSGRPWTPSSPSGRQDPDRSRPAPQRGCRPQDPEKDPLDYDDGAWM
jgi:hypothetical protein